MLTAVAVLITGGVAAAQESQRLAVGAIDLCLAPVHGPAASLIEAAGRRGYPAFVDAPDFRPSPPAVFESGGRSTLGAARDDPVFVIQSSTRDSDDGHRVRWTACGVFAGQPLSVPFTQRLTARLGAASGPPERRAWSAIETGGRLRSLTDEEDRQLDQTGALLSRLPPGSRLVTVLLRTSNGASYWVINLYERLGRPT